MDEALNYIKTGGMFGRKRRFPTFIIEKADNGRFIAKDETNNMQIRCSSLTLEGLEAMLRPYCDVRTMPR